jgi:putative transposase
MHGGTQMVADRRRSGWEIDALPTPFRSLRTDGSARRVIRTLRRECLDHALVYDERHLQDVLQEYVAYHNTDRPHRSLGLVPPLPVALPLRAPPGPPGRIVARPVLCGLHHLYHRAA